jgi:hypothetical protein
MFIFHLKYKILLFIFNFIIQIQKNHFENTSFKKKSISFNKKIFIIKVIIIIFNFKIQRLE